MGYKNKYMRGLQATLEDIGKVAVVRCNSHAVTLPDGQDAELAQKEVIIAGVSHTITIEPKNRRQRRTTASVVTVRIGDQLYQCWNVFDRIGDKLAPQPK